MLPDGSVPVLLTAATIEVARVPRRPSGDLAGNWATAATCSFLERTLTALALNAACHLLDAAEARLLVLEADAESAPIAKDAVAVCTHTGFFVTEAELLQ